MYASTYPILNLDVVCGTEMFNFLNCCYYSVDNLRAELLIEKLGRWESRGIK